MGEGSLGYIYYTFIHIGHLQFQPGLMLNVFRHHQQWPQQEQQQQQKQRNPTSPSGQEWHNAMDVIALI